MIKNKKEVTDTNFVVVLLEELLQFVEGKKKREILSCKVEFTGLYPLNRLEMKLNLIYH